jgi:PKD repeat protein
MVTHRRPLLALLALSLALAAACDKVPLLAPTGSVITLFPVTTTVSLNSEVTIIATVIENGSAPAGTGTGSGVTGTTTNTGAGTPVQNGTLITFTTTIGRIEPSEARTHNGQVSVKLITGGTSGSATITAYSGGASAQITNLKIGTAAAKTVLLTTTPQGLGASGGTVQVTATVTDEGGNPLSGIPVTFATDKGTISPSTATTDGSGNATAALTTTATAKVTATAGTVTSAAATVTVNARSLAGFSASPSSANAGVPITFTVTPTAGANLSNVRVDFGDGSGQDLGAITAAQTIPHAYSSAGNYTATATARDSFGDSGSLSTSVVIGSLAVTLTSFPSGSAPVNSSVTFTVGGTSSAQVDRYVWSFDDGTPPQTTTSPQLPHTFTTRGIKNVRVDVIGVGGGVVGTAALAIQIT